MANNTKTGLFFILIGLIISLISSFFLIVTGVSFDSSAIGIFVIGISFIALIGGILTLIGAIFVIIGRKEYGIKHSKFVIYAVILYIIGFVATVIFTSLITYIYVSSLIFEGKSDFPGFFGIITFIATIIFSIAIVLFFHELEDKKGKIILYSYFILTNISAFLISIFTIEAFNEIFQSMKENSLNTFQNSLISSQLLQLGSLSIVAYIVSFIANLLLIFAVYIAYNRIKSGELKQVLPDYLKRCPYCGRTGPADSIVCAYCGNRFNDFKIY